MSPPPLYSSGTLHHLVHRHHERHRQTHTRPPTRQSQLPPLPRYLDIPVGVAPFTYFTPRDGDSDLVRPPWVCEEEIMALRLGATQASLGRGKGALVCKGDVHSSR